MRTFMPFAILLMLSCASCFDYQSFMGGSSYKAVNFTYNNQPAQAIVSGQAVHALLLPTLPFGELMPTTDSGQIALALNSYYLASGYSQSAISGMPSVHSGIVSVRKNKDAGEAKCRILTGADRTACTTFESCQKACYSVTSFCLPVALGAGRTFIDEIWKFENNSRQLEAAYNAEADAYSALESSSTRKNVEAYLESLSDLNRAATRASTSQLFDGYSYCYLPDYSLAVITNMQLSAQKYWQNSSRFFYIEDESQSVKVRTMEGLQRIAAAEANIAPAGLPENATAIAQNSTNKTDPSAGAKPAASAAPGVDSTQAAIACGAFALLIAIAGAVAFFLGKKKKL